MSELREVQATAWDITPEIGDPVYRTTRHMRGHGGCAASRDAARAARFYTPVTDSVTEH